MEGMSNLMLGLLIVSDMSDAEKGKYQFQITSWYERAMDCDDEAVKSRVGFMVVSQYLRRQRI